MRITDLLEELQKHGEENIEFSVFDVDGNTILKLEPYISTVNEREMFIYKIRGDKNLNTVILAFIKKEENA